MGTINMMVMLIIAIIIAVFLYQFIVSKQRLLYDNKINIELMVKGGLVNLVIVILYVYGQANIYRFLGEAFNKQWHMATILPYAVLLVLFYVRVMFNKVIKPKHYINKYDIVIYALSMAIGIGISNLLLLGLFDDVISSILMIISAIVLPLSYMMTMAYFLIKYVEGKRWAGLLSVILPFIIIYLEEGFNVYDSILGLIGYVGFVLLMNILFTVLFTNIVRKNTTFDMVDAEKQMDRFTNQQTMQERLSYRFDKFMSYGNLAITGILILFAFIVVIVVSIILMIETPEITSGSFSDMLWLSFMRVLDPGNVATDTEYNNIKFLTITTIATFIGLGVIATYIGIISGEMGSRIEKLREGNSKILEKEHILFIGFCEDTLKILDNLIRFHIGSDKLSIIIVSRMPRKSIEEQIQAYGLHNTHNRIICRSGDLYSINTLYNVGITSASKVVIIGDHQEESLRIAMSVNSILKGMIYKHIDVTLMSDTGYDLNLARQTFGKRMHIYSREELDFNPLIRSFTLKEYMKLYGSLMGADANLLIYLDVIKKTIGKQFGQIATAFSYSTVVGIERKGEILLNPHKAIVIEKSDRLIFLTDSNVQPDFGGVNRLFKMDYSKVGSYEFISESIGHVLIIGDHHLEHLEAHLDEEKINKTIALIEENEDFYHSLDEIMSKDSPDIVVFLGDCSKTVDENDDIALQIFAYLDSNYNRKVHNYTIAAVINSAQDVKFAYDLDYVDLVIESDKCRNVALTLVDKDNMTGKVEEQLFEVGNRIGALLAHHVVGLGEHVVSEVNKECIKQDMILVGYITREGGLIDVSINPNKNDKVSFDDDDILLIIK